MEISQFDDATNRAIIEIVRQEVRTAKNDLIQQLQRQRATPAEHYLARLRETPVDIGVDKSKPGKIDIYRRVDGDDLEIVFEDQPCWFANEPIGNLFIVHRDPWGDWWYDGLTPAVPAVSLGHASPAFKVTVDGEERLRCRKFTARLMTFDGSPDEDTSSRRRWTSRLDRPIAS